jgi:hypothetical protein
VQGRTSTPTKEFPQGPKGERWDFSAPRLALLNVDSKSFCHDIQQVISEFFIDNKIIVKTWRLKVSSSPIATYIPKGPPTFSYRQNNVNFSEIGKKS